MGPQFDLGHILQPNHRTVRKGPHDHLLEVLYLREAALRNHRNRQFCAFGGRLPPHHAGRKVPILLADNIRNVSRCKAQLRHPDRVQNQPHTIVLLSKHVGVAHAFEPFDIVDHSENGIVGEKDGVVSRIAGAKGNDRQQVRRYFLHANTLADDFRRQLRFCQLFTVLSLNLRDIHVRSDLEREPDGHVAIVGARRVVVKEIVDTG